MLVTQLQISNSMPSNILLKIGYPIALLCLKCQALKKKLSVYEAEGCRVMIEDYPFAVCIITPLMLRCHALPSAAEICFVDSTASCDADNHAITFMLTTSPAGAVPLAVMITKVRIMLHMQFILIQNSTIKLVKPPLYLCYSKNLGAVYARLRSCIWNPCQM